MLRTALLLLGAPSDSCMPNSPVAQRATGCWKRCASTRWKTRGVRRGRYRAHPHRDHYTVLVAQRDAPADCDYEQLIEQAETEIDNLRAAFGWCGQSCFIKCFHGKQTQVARTMTGVASYPFCAACRNHCKSWRI